jgi:hypothetical protein
VSGDFMKKILIGIVALCSFSAMASNSCNAFIPQSSKIKKELTASLEKYGWNIVNDRKIAELTVEAKIFQPHNAVTRNETSYKQALIKVSNSNFETVIANSYEKNSFQSLKRFDSALVKLEDGVLNVSSPLLSTCK